VLAMLLKEKYIQLSEWGISLLVVSALLIFVPTCMFIYLVFGDPWSTVCRSMRLGPALGLYIVTILILFRSSQSFFHVNTDK
jgi:hypothetical protein